MAAATSGVATETGGAKELIQPRETGVLVPIGDVEELFKAIADAIERREHQKSRLVKSGANVQ